LHAIHKVLEGSLTQTQAAEIISLSERQIRRTVKRIEAEGDKGIQHRSRGKESNRRLPRKLVAKVVQLYQAKYQGFELPSDDPASTTINSIGRYI
jgi:transcriptional antiterminator